MPVLGHICEDNQLPYTKDADAWELSVDDQGGVLQYPQAETHADTGKTGNCCLEKSPGNRVRTLVGHSFVDN